MKRAILFFLSVVGLLAGQNAVRAQINNPYSLYYNLQMNQQAQNYMQMRTAQSVFANAAATMNPGWNNPYLGTSFGGVPYNPYNPISPIAPITPISGGDGYGSLANPYAPGGAGMGIGNPYMPGINPWNPWMNPFNSPGFGVGQYLQGSADVMRAYGTVINAQESARLLREQALQAKLDTRKKAFELEMYIKANTPTYTQEQERIAKSTLRRIQTNSLPGEVTNGKSLNYLLDDLRKFPNKKIALEPISMSEGVLSRLSVSKGTYGLGLLRDDGRVTFPTVLQERMSVKQQKELSEQMKDLVKQAYKGQLDVNALKNVRTEMEKLREDLVRRVNDTPTAQYMDAKRFLQEFNEAAFALEKGEAPLQAKFQRFIEGGKSIQEVADYMVQNGLRFSPATADDEAAYRAVHSALATFDIAMNSSFGVVEPRDQ